ncbi:phosphotransferase [bacterium]|nr:phosphotransferase [bacterium]
MSATPDEVVLKGGRANTGNVVRIGDQVARPAYPQTKTVEHFLQHLIQAGANFVPEPLGFDEQGRHRLRFIKGTAPAPPYSSWAFDETLLLQVATHQRKLHTLAQSYDIPDDASWANSAGDYFPPQALIAEKLVVCHNDLGMTNVIVDNEHRLVGFIDFDYCRPVDRLFDIAVAVRHWAPFGDLDLVTGQEPDRVRRFRLFCDVHELDHAERRRVVDLATLFLEQARRNITALAAAGGAGFQTLLDTGYEATNRATVAWLVAHTETLATT